MAGVRHNRTQGVTILGSTGSIGRNTLAVLARHPEHFDVVALSAHGNTDLLARQCHRHKARYAVISDKARAGDLQTALDHLGCRTRVLAGRSSLSEVVALEATDIVMAAIVGAAGLEPTLHAVASGKRLLLANKESMVIAGELFQQAAAASGSVIIPVDSEHNALFQVLPANFGDGLESVGVEKLILTASGGPFLRSTQQELETVTPEQACNHPNWDMGQKISVDSATLMNKGLEVIEACWLYAMAEDEVQVIIHPQSVVHSMVQYLDGSVLAQLGNPDMRTPIAHCLAWPQRIAAGVEPLDVCAVGRLEFEPPDLRRFPCLRLAQQAWRSGGTSATILNAANEVAVQAFLDRQLAFTGIPGIIEATLERLAAGDADSIERILEDDGRARDCAMQLVAQHSGQRMYS